MSTRFFSKLGIFSVFSTLHHPHSALAAYALFVVSALQWLSFGYDPELSWGSSWLDAIQVCRGWLGDKVGRLRRVGGSFRLLSRLLTAPLVAIGCAAQFAIVAVVRRLPPDLPGSLYWFALGLAVTFVLATTALLLHVANQTVNGSDVSDLVARCVSWAFVAAPIMCLVPISSAPLAFWNCDVSRYTDCGTGAWFVSVSFVRCLPGGVPLCGNGVAREPGRHKTCVSVGCCRVLGMNRVGLRQPG